MAQKLITDIKADLALGQKLSEYAQMVLELGEENLRLKTENAVLRKQLSEVENGAPKS